MKTLLGLAALTLLASCGKVESPEQFFDITGDNGKSGKPGQSCYGESAQGGVNIICGDEVNFVADGTDGVDGENGTDGVDGQDGLDGIFHGYVEYRVVCPEIAGEYKETLMFLDGQYLAFYSSPQYKKQRLAILEENTSYGTTDDRNVVFQIENGEIICE